MSTCQDLQIYLSLKLIRRAERALISVVAESYVRGVSTRRVEGLVQTLGIERLSKSQVSEMSKSLDELVEDFRSRPLEGSYPFLWLDATVLKSRKAAGSSTALSDERAS